MCILESICPVCAIPLAYNKYTACVAEKTKEMPVRVCETKHFQVESMLGEHFSQRYADFLVENYLLTAATQTNTHTQLYSMWYTHTKPVVLMLCLIVPNPFKMCVHCVIVARCLGPSMYQVETYEIQISVCVQCGIQLQACFDDKDSQKPKNNSPSNWALFNDSIILGKMRKIQKTGWKYREIHWQMSLRFCWPRVLFFIDKKKRLMTRWKQSTGKFNPSIHKLPERWETCMTSDVANLLSFFRIVKKKLILVHIVFDITFPIKFERCTKKSVTKSWTMWNITIYLSRETGGCQESSVKQYNIFK